MISPNAIIRIDLYEYDEDNQRENLLPLEYRIRGNQTWGRIMDHYAQRSGKNLGELVFRSGSPEPVNDRGPLNYSDYLYQTLPNIPLISRLPWPIYVKTIPQNWIRIEPPRSRKRRASQSSRSLRSKRKFFSKRNKSKRKRRVKK